MRQNILIFTGILGILAGVLFMLQGAGIVRAPVDSFMIDNRDWIWRGAIIAVISGILVAGVRLVPTGAEERARRKAERDARRAERDSQ